MGIVQHHAFFSIPFNNTVEINIFRKINLLGHSGHLEEKNDDPKPCFLLSYLSDIIDLAVTYRDYKNALNM